MPNTSFAPGQTPGLEHTAYFIARRRRRLQRHPRRRGRGRSRRPAASRSSSYAVAHDSGNIIDPTSDRRRPVWSGGGAPAGIERKRCHVRVREVRRRRQSCWPPRSRTTSCQRPAMCRASPSSTIETPTCSIPFGVKGAGEGGTAPGAGGIIAAIEDALSTFGVHFTDMPLTPDRIVAAMHATAEHMRS